MTRKGRWRVQGMLPSLRWAMVIVAMLVVAGEARAQLRPGAEPADLLLESRLAFHRGDYAGAARLAAGLPPGIAAVKEVADFVRLTEATLAMDARLAHRESEHFLLGYDADRDWVLVEPALEALEAGHRALGAWLGERPTGKVRVEIVPSAREFESVSGLTPKEIETAGAVGVCAFNKIMMLSPRLLLRGYPWRDALNHEYVHYLLVRLSGNRAPIWLQEGVARYAESRWRSGGEAAFLDDTDRSLLARALRENGLLTLADMNSSLVRLPTMGAVRLAFAECALAAEHLIGAWGLGGLRGVLAALADQPDPGDVDAALQAAIGTSLAAFERGWRQALEQRKFREVEGLGVPAYRLAGEGDIEAWDLADWQPLEAQNHLKLGDMLRTRGNARAGLMEYERALRIAPASPYAHIQAARAQLALGRADRAAASAREAVRLAGAYPAAHEVLAEALAKLGDAGGAAKALRAALEVNPYNPFAWRDLGRALRRLGRTAEAQEAGVIALRLGPGDEKFQRSVMESP
jgi:tetratricopeptide (TPR) repeat protein